MIALGARASLIKMQSVWRPSVVTRFVERLGAAGVELWRVRYALMTMHPELLWRTVHWRDGEGVEVIDQPRARLDDPYYTASAVAVVRRSRGSVRVRLVPAELPFPICHDLRDEGATDYLVQALPFTNEQVSYVSFATRDPAGFSDATIETLESIRPFLARRLELESAYYATRALLDVYLGKNAARRCWQVRFSADRVGRLVPHGQRSSRDRRRERRLPGGDPDPHESVGPQSGVASHHAVHPQDRGREGLHRRPVDSHDQGSVYRRHRARRWREHDVHLGVLRAVEGRTEDADVRAARDPYEHRGRRGLPRGVVSDVRLPREARSVQGLRLDVLAVRPFRLLPRRARKGARVQAGEVYADRSRRRDRMRGPHRAMRHVRRRGDCLPALHLGAVPIIVWSLTEKRTVLERS